jgi:hypothetical protein
MIMAGISILMAGYLASGCKKTENDVRTPGGSNPRAPVVSPIADQVINLPQNKVTLDGFANIAANPADMQLSFRWNLVAKPSTNTTLVINRSRSATTDVSGFTEGNYLFTLDITNTLGITSTDSVAVNVLPDSLKGLTRVYEGLIWEYDFDDWMGNYSYLAIHEPGTFQYRDIQSMDVKVLNENNQAWFDENSFYMGPYAGGLTIFKYDDSTGALVGKKAKLQVTFQ